MNKAYWLAGLLCSASFMANATTISYAADCTGVVGPCTTVGTMQHGMLATNWEFNPIYPKFNPTLGTLNSITFTLAGTMNGVYGLENLHATNTMFSQNVSVQADVSFMRADDTVLVVTLPGQNFGTRVNYAKYDGTTDYGPNSPRTGSSGYTYFASGEDTQGYTTMDVADLLHHIGAGNVSDWKFTATDLTSGTVSGGTLSSIKQVNAMAMLTVTYDYTESTSEVPEPATSAMAGGALMLLGVLARRFRR